MTGSLEERVREHLRAELRKALAEMNAARDEVWRLWEEREKIYGPLEKKKTGRPTVWKGFIGMVLVEAVEEILIRRLRREENIREDDDDWRSIDLRDPDDYEDLEIANSIHAHGGRRLYNLAQAIRKAVRTHPMLQRHKNVFDRLSDRALQARYQMAADYFSKSRVGARDRAHESARKRWEEAREEVDRLCDLLDD